MILRSLWICASLLVIPSAAIADWEYTKWGMSPDQVVKASKGKAQQHPRDADNSTDGADALVSGTYSAAGYNFTTHFRFGKNDGGLSAVLHELKPPSKCGELFASLQNIYGKPDNDILTPGILSGHVWRDQKKDNHVSLLSIGPDLAPSSCDLTYKRLTPAGGGL